MKMEPTSAQPGVFKEAKHESPCKIRTIHYHLFETQLLSVGKSAPIIRAKIETVGCKMQGSRQHGEETLCG